MEIKMEVKMSGEMNCMNENATVSVIIPVYNTVKYLKKCVNSLIAQTYQNVEILLVDDGSTDDSGALCDWFANKYPQIQVFHKENGGLVSSWKYGTERSRGEYLCYVDSDDWVDPQMLAEMMQHVTGGDREIISSDYVIERDNGTSEAVYQRLAPGEYERDTLVKKVLPYVLGQEHRYVTISRCMKLISRKLVLDNMHYCDPSIRMGEDMTLMLPALLDCERLVVMDHKAYYHYLYVTASMVHQYDPGLYENNKKLMEIVKHVLEDKCCHTSGVTMPDYAWMLDQADREYLFLLLLALKNEARGNPAGYAKNIREICNDPEVKELLQKTTVEIHEKSNLLLYLVLLHPNAFMIKVLRSAMRLYYK